MTPLVTAGIALATALATFLGYALANTGILKHAEAWAQKVKNAETWLTKEIGKYIPAGTVIVVEDEITKLAEAGVIALAARVTHLSQEEIRTILDALLRATFPAPAPAKTLTLNVDAGQVAQQIVDNLKAKLSEASLLDETTDAAPAPAPVTTK